VHPYSYQITVSGDLGDAGREAFDDFKIESYEAITVLTGYLDQAALYGTLNRLMSLGFELVRLDRVAGGRRTGRQG
jgi:hypothetical protein